MAITAQAQDIHIEVMVDGKAHRLTHTEALELQADLAAALRDTMVLREERAYVRAQVVTPGDSNWARALAEVDLSQMV